MSEREREERMRARQRTVAERTGAMHSMAEIRAQHDTSAHAVCATCATSGEVVVPVITRSVMQ